MPNGDVVILHLSDTQFGQYHRFQGTGNALSSRLLQDLKDQDYRAGSIDLIVLSGDIVERGAASEFDIAHDFLVALCGQLEVPRDHVILVPGNHDVNWDLCRAYFSDCSAREIEPVEPYEAKYEFYLGFVDRFLESSGAPTYRLHHFPAMDLSIAALDSTRQETHETHYGWCGESQLRDIANQLRAAGAKRRIAVLHHNVRRGAVADNEHLRDEDDLAQILGPEVDVVLHGHTHNGRRDSLSDGTLVLSTGSAAVSADWRPGEVPNQYQILTWDADGITRKARRYEPDLHRWVPDSRFGTEDRPGRESIPLPLLGRDRQRSDRGRRGPSSRPAGLAAVVVGGSVDAGEIKLFRNQLRPKAFAVDPSQLSDVDLLSDLGLTHNGEPRLAGLLLFGRQPQAHAASAVVQCVRYLGRDKSAARESFHFGGPIPRQLDAAVDFLGERLPRRERPGRDSARAEVEHLYPMRCLREVLVNALVHRDYTDEARSAHVSVFDDRVEIASPGDWGGHALGADQVSLRVLTSQSVRRNPLLGRTLSLSRYFEGEGSGIPSAVADCREVGAREPTARFEDGFVVVTVWPSEFDPEIVSRARRAVVVEASVRDRNNVFALGEMRDVFIEPRLLASESGGSEGHLVGAVDLLEPRARTVVVSGPAGSGKTFLAKKLAARVAESPDVLPILLGVGDLRSTENRLDLVRSAIAERWATYGLEVSERDIGAILTSVPTLLIVDGLDEVEFRRRDPVLRALGEVVRSSPGVRAVVTTRPSTSGEERNHRDDVLSYDLQPWTMEDFEEYVSQVASLVDGVDSTSRSLLDVVARDSATRDFVSSPLLAGLIVELWSANGRLSRSRFEIVGRAVDLLGMWDEMKGSDVNRELRWLGARAESFLAFEALLDGEPWHGMRRTWVASRLGYFVAASGAPSEVAESLLGLWRDRSGVLGEVGGERFAFSRRAFAAYRAAEGAIERWRGDYSGLARFLLSEAKDETEFAGYVLYHDGRRGTGESLLGRELARLVLSSAPAFGTQAWLRPCLEELGAMSGGRLAASYLDAASMLPE